MKVSSDTKKRITQGDIKLLGDILQIELEDIKTQLLVYKPDKDGYDNVLKGKGQIIETLLTLLKG